MLLLPPPRELSKRHMNETMAFFRANCKTKYDCVTGVVWLEGQTI